MYSIVLITRHIVACNMNVISILLIADCLFLLSTVSSWYLILPSVTERDFFSADQPNMHQGLISVLLLLAQVLCHGKLS